MIRITSFLILTLVSAAPAAASTYSATMSQPTGAQFIARDISWTCRASRCQGATDESRPLVLCESLAKRAGRVESFLVDDRPLPAPDLERCNASAKGQPSPSAAGK